MIEGFLEHIGAKHIGMFKDGWKFIYNKKMFYIENFCGRWFLEFNENIIWVDATINIKSFLTALNKW